MPDNFRRQHACKSRHHSSRASGTRWDAQSAKRGAAQLRWHGGLRVSSLPQAVGFSNLVQYWLCNLFGHMPSQAKPPSGAVAQETFISADDLRVNLWHLDVTDQCFTIVDIKPPNMEDLTEARRFAVDTVHSKGRYEID